MATTTVDPLHQYDNQQVKLMEEQVILVNSLDQVVGKASKKESEFRETDRDTATRRERAERHTGH